MLTDEHVHLLGRAFGLDDDFLGALCRRLSWLRMAGLAVRYGFLLSAVLFALRAVGGTRARLSKVRRRQAVQVRPQTLDLVAD